MMVVSRNDSYDHEPTIVSLLETVTKKWLLLNIQ